MQTPPRTPSPLTLTPGEFQYIEDNEITINDIDTMIDAYMKMVKDKYLFLIDRDLLKDLLVEITYMYSPNDDANKDRVLYHLVGSDSDDDDDDDDSSSRKVDGSNNVD